jgi:hypothetical protein
MNEAGIPLKFRSLGRKDYLPKGQILFDYLGSDAYASDVAAGRGVCLSGDPAIRSDLLALMAKATAIAGRSTVLISLHLLVSVLETNEERRAFIQRCDFLMLDWFEREFRTDEAPYTYSQISEVEDFLVARANAARVTNFTACRRFDQLKWWSRDFLGMMEPKVVDITLG